MRIFYDTEFNELGPEFPIELISIGMVADDGREYYAVAADGWRLDHCSDWVRENVLPYLGGPWKSRASIRREVQEFVLYQGGTVKPELWAYFADYDHVLLSLLFGRMIDLPKGFPKYTRDIKQLMDHYGIEKSEMPKQEGQDHNALADARHNKVMLDFIEKKHPPLDLKAPPARKCQCGAVHAQPCANCGGLYAHQPLCSIGHQ
jgi:hypothetical protein